MPYCNLPAIVPVAPDMLKSGGERMGKKAKLFALVLGVVVTFSAGVYAGEGDRSRVLVENISVRGVCPKGWVLRKYTEEETLGAVLGGLRSFRREGAAREDPMTLSGSDYAISIGYSDGSRRSYRLKGSKYLQMDGGIWYRVDEDRARDFEELLWRCKSDRGVDLGVSP